MADPNPLANILDGVERLSARAQDLSAQKAVENVEVAEVISALNSYTEIVRYLNTRRSRGAILQLDDEASVQDVLYLMLRPWVTDLTPESPTSKVGNRYAIKDFASPLNRFVVEAKFIRNSDHGKNITKEINDDIETYRYHPACDDLIFFIYDPENLIPDALKVKDHIETERVYAARSLRCHSVIKP